MKERKRPEGERDVGEDNGTFQPEYDSRAKAP